MADEIPGDLRYTETDEWIRTEGDEVAIGVTAFAADQLGDVVYVQLPEVGRECERGEAYGEVESVKAVADLYAPLSGAIVAVNTDLDQNPDLVNEDPYGRGWMVRMKVVDVSQLDSLLDAEAYQRSTAERA
jgi:glycine cleavage system H protein